MANNKNDDNNNDDNNDNSDNDNYNHSGHDNNDYAEDRIYREFEKTPMMANARLLEMASKWFYLYGRRGRLRPASYDTLDYDGR